MNRPKYSGTTDWDTGKTTPLKPSSPLWKKGAMDKHNKAMDDVERKRAARAAKKKVVTHAQDTLKSEEKGDKDWIQIAVDPAHKGDCTPMTKKTCTPRRKALAKRFKKAASREGTKAGGKTGWKGKV